MCLPTHFHSCHAAASSIPHILFHLVSSSRTQGHHRQFVIGRGANRRLQTTTGWKWNNHGGPERKSRPACLCRALLRQPAGPASSAHPAQAPRPEPEAARPTAKRKPGPSKRQAHVAAYPSRPASIPARQQPSAMAAAAFLFARAAAPALLPPSRRLSRRLVASSSSGGQGALIPFSPPSRGPTPTRPLPCRAARLLVLLAAACVGDGKRQDEWGIVSLDDAGLPAHRYPLVCDWWLSQVAGEWSSRGRWDSWGSGSWARPWHPTSSTQGKSLHSFPLQPWQAAVSSFGFCVLQMRRYGVEQDQEQV